MGMVSLAAQSVPCFCAATTSAPCCVLGPASPSPDVILVPGAREGPSGPPDPRSPRELALGPGHSNQMTRQEWETRRGCHQAGEATGSSFQGRLGVRQSWTPSGIVGGGAGSWAFLGLGHKVLGLWHQVKASDGHVLSSLSHSPSHSRQGFVVQLWLSWNSLSTSIDQAGFELTATCLPLTPECRLSACCLLLQ